MNPQETAGAAPHISVCICTLKRPALLRRLLEALVKQDTGGVFSFSIVVVDNDEAESARAIVEECRALSQVRITYCTEPRRNIALARNKAIQNAKGDFIAFIDDDEFPGNGWLGHLFATCRKYRASGVLGPVKPFFPQPPPEWL
ncbi:glycosyltransferase family 2 protein, partial [Nitrospira sp. BLG_2]|uniref:glycosyltransferase family 2 protein n=1 Tax=Nitrospira sp. BLG_2 TaxID=3397507 RepID=UPI003B9AE394